MDQSRKKGAKTYDRLTVLYGVFIFACDIMGGIVKGRNRYLQKTKKQKRR